MLPGRAASVQLNAWMRGKGFDSPGFGIEDGWLAMLFGGTPGLLTRAQVRMLVHEGYRHTTLAEVHAIAVNAGWAIQTIVVPQGQLNVPQWDFCEPGIVLAPTRGGWHFAAIQAGTQRQFNALAAATADALRRIRRSGLYGSADVHKHLLQSLVVQGAAPEEIFRLESEGAIGVWARNESRGPTC